MATQGEEWMAGLAGNDSYDGRSGPTIEIVEHALVYSVTRRFRRKPAKKLKKSHVFFPAIARSQLKL